MTGERLDELHIPMMVEPQQLALRHAVHGLGRSARRRHDRHLGGGPRPHRPGARSTRRRGRTTSSMPGHMFPLRAREGGVLVRAGQTEATVDLCKLAGLYPAGVLCEIMNADGTMARLPDLKRFAQAPRSQDHQRHADDQVPPAQGEARPPRRRDRAADASSATWKCIAYKALTDPDEHVAFVFGDVRGDEPVLVRVHGQCVTGDVFGSQRCDCGEQLRLAPADDSAEGRGVFVYMRQEGRGIGLHNKLQAPTTCRTAAWTRSRPT